ncbi:MAG: thioredoxin family protein [Candidatus Marinimicrobia bacterium]|nr:thioredoxin family protein [Candidatus Neomarinimicrobiota bacterium]
MLISCGKSPKPLPKLLDLGADKCIPCKEMAPILEELKKEYAGVLDVEFIDVWKPENQQAAEKYGIRSIPTQIFFDPEGKELWRHVGFISKADILNKWKELGYSLKAKNAAVVQDDCTDCSSCGNTEESRTCE